MGRVPALGQRTREPGASLIGLLVVLVALGAMAALAASALTGEQGTGALPDLAAGVPEEGAAPATPRPASVASVAACNANAVTLETAMSLAHGTDGTYPRSFSDLVARGFLSELPGGPGLDFAPEVVDGRSTGRVLVNGLPRREGCG